MKIQQVALGVMTCMISTISAHAQDAGTMAKVNSSGTIVLGVRDSSAPLSYTLGGSKFLGYHIELCENIVNALFPKANIRYQVVTSQNRMPLLQKQLQ